MQLQRWVWGVVTAGAVVLAGGVAFAASGAGSSSGSASGSSASGSASSSGAAGAATVDPCPHGGTARTAPATTATSAPLAFM